MPKIVTEAEREQVRDAIYSKTIVLIREKGLKKVTVDDIAAAVGISKGAFYGYYPSREIGLYEVLKRGKTELFSRMEGYMTEGFQTTEQVERFFREVYLAPESVILQLSPIEQEALMRKLPPEYRDMEQDSSTDFFRRSLALLGLDDIQMEALALLTDCIGLVAVNTQYSEDGKQRALDVLIVATARYLLKEENQ